MTSAQKSITRLNVSCSFFVHVVASNGWHVGAHIDRSGSKSSGRFLHYVIGQHLHVDGHRYDHDSIV